MLILFAKIPQIGRVKTRLSPPLTLLKASQVAKFLLETALENACRYWPGQVVLAVWPYTDHQIITDLKKALRFEVRLQAGGDLGDKMQSQFAHYIKKNQPAAIMGCDVPQCGESTYKQAYQALSQGENLIGPTFDGGYYIIGVQNQHRRMFQQVQWGSIHAYQQTLARCSQYGVQFDLKLPQLRDLDDYEDLVALKSDCNRLEQFLV